MGGCYTGSDSYSGYERTYRAVPDWEKGLKGFFRKKEGSQLIEAYHDFFKENKKGFFSKVAEAAGIKDVADIPKEFKETEYEVKFDITPIKGAGSRSEPSLEKYLDAFQYPAGPSARFLKDPVNAISEGKNHFLGDDLDERLVVIEKGGKKYLKEKGLVTPVSFGIPYENIVIKRTEKRYEASIEEVLEKVGSVVAEAGVKYQGVLRKEKGDFFVLDTNDGRIYSMTVTRAHKDEGKKGKQEIASGVQRQLELEYAGYIPGFSGFRKDSEEDLVRGMIDLAKHTFFLYNGAPIADSWRMGLEITSERKYDFVKDGKKGKADEKTLIEEQFLLPSPKLMLKGVRNKA